MCLTGCGGNDTPEQIPETNETTTEAASEETTPEAVSEETTAPEESINVYETLAEGQERDWKIEDVLKNDLEIDGIPISIPCTKNELKDMLGDGYSFVRHNQLGYKGDVTLLMISTFSDDDNTVCGFAIMNTLNYVDPIYYMVEGPDLNFEKGVLWFKSTDNTYQSVISNYPDPNEIKIEENGDRLRLRYSDESCFMDLVLHDDVIYGGTIGYITEETE